MLSIPAFCDTCGTVFHSGIAVENVARATFISNSAGPCPPAEVAVTYQMEFSNLLEIRLKSSLPPSELLMNLEV